MYTNTGCKRLVDYYFVVSCSDHGKEQTKRRLCRQSLAPPHEKEARHALFALKPKIVDRYPSRNYSDTPLLPWVARASMPRGVRARTIPPAPRYFTFTGWNIDGSKLYGACLEVFEKMDIKKQRQPVYIPKTLGFISHYPYFYAFDVFLRCLWHVIPKKLIRLEDLLMHYFYDIPAPLPRKKIAYDLGKMKVLLACRNEFDVPIMELPIETPFTQLSKDRICMIIKLLLLEHRIVFVCTLVHELTPVCELFASLLFPLRWRNLFIPLVCRPMAEALKKMADYEHPFLVGLPRFVYVRPEISSAMPNNTYIVFLDRNEITDEKKQSIPSSCIPNLPSPLEENLRDSIHALARVLTMPDGTVSRDVILQAFRTMFAVITKLLFIAQNTNLIHDHDNGNNPSFVSLFKQTNLFKSFQQYYCRINPSDPQLKSIYPFFKQNEALGKHFARRSHSNSWSAGFDQSQYSRDAFRVNQDVIKRVEKQFAKKRADLAASNRNTKFSLPQEFQHLQQVKEFLQQYVFYSNSNSNSHSHSHSNRSTNANTSTSQQSKDYNNNTNKLETKKRIIKTENSNANTNKNKKIRGKKKSSKKRNFDKQKSVKKKSLKKSIQNSNIKESDKSNSKMNNKEMRKVHVNNGEIKEKKLENGKSKKEAEDNEDMDMDEDEDIDSDESESDGSDDSEGSDDSDGSYDSDSDSDGDEDDDDSSGWSVEGGFDDEDDWRLNDESRTDLRRNSAAAVRHNRRFQNLAEFELTIQEKQWFVNCQKQHNLLIANVADIKPIIAQDLFDDNVLKSWKSFQHKKIHKQYKKPKGS